MSHHKEHVCGLYRRALRTAFDWISDREEHRRFCLAVRRQFDRHREERHPEKLSLLLDATRYLLWKHRHPEPYIYPTAPGGVAYDREPKFDANYLKNGYNPDMETY